MLFIIFTLEWPPVCLEHKPQWMWPWKRPLSRIGDPPGFPSHERRRMYHTPKTERFTHEIWAVCTVELDTKPPILTQQAAGYDVALRTVPILPFATYGSVITRSWIWLHDGVYHLNLIIIVTAITLLLSTTLNSLLNWMIYYAINVLWSIQI